MKKQNIDLRIREMMMVVALMVLEGSAWGQNRGDTIFVKEPTYVYSLWIEDAVDSATEGFWYPALPFFAWDPCDSTETAMRFYSDIPLQIVGAAGILNLEARYVTDTNRFHKQVDYFHLYEIDDNDQLVRLNSARVPLDMNPTRWMEAGYRNVPRCVESIYISPEEYNVYKRVLPVIECFFEKPSFVQDSFYLGLTNRSLMDRRVDFVSNGQIYWTYNKPILSAGSILYPYPPVECEGAEIVLQQYRKLNVDCQWEYWQDHSMMLIWPIFDTNGLHVFNPLDTMECAQVDGMRVVTQMDDCYLLTWNGSERQHKWELAYGPEGSTPEECTVVECNTPQKFLCGVDTTARTVVYARGYCGRYKWGEWSEGLEIGAPRDTVGPDDPEEGIEPTLADRFVTLVPNPGSEWMQVLSSFGMRRVVVTDAAGRVVMDEERRGVSAEVDVRGWRRGTYFVQVMTAAGTTTKKFVKL